MTANELKTFVSERQKMRKRDKSLKDIYSKNQFHLATNGKGFGYLVQTTIE